MGTTMRRDLMVIIVAIVILCPLGIATMYYTSQVMPMWAAFAVAFFTDCCAGYAFLGGMLAPVAAPGAEPATPGPSTATPAQKALPPKKQPEAPPRQSKPVKDRPGTVVAESQRTEQAKPDDDLVKRIATLPELRGVDAQDIAKVVGEYHKGTKVGQIYKALHWGSRRHKDTIKPVIDALRSMAA